MAEMGVERAGVRASKPLRERAIPLSWAQVTLLYRVPRKPPPPPGDPRSMALPSLQHLARDRRDPTEYELRSARFDGQDVAIRLRLRQAGDGSWVGALVFRRLDTGAERATAEILRGASEQQVWESVRGLGTHHLRDLFRSLT